MENGAVTQHQNSDKPGKKLSGRSGEGRGEGLREREREPALVSSLLLPSHPSACWQARRKGEGQGGLSPPKIFGSVKNNEITARDRERKCCKFTQDL